MKANVLIISIRDVAYTKIENKMTNRVVTKLKKVNSVDPDESTCTSRLIWTNTVCKTILLSVKWKRLTNPLRFRRGTRMFVFV